VLQAQQLLRALLGRDLAPDAEVAAECAAFVEQRLRAEREPHRAAVVGPALDLEVLERLVVLDLGAMPVPVRLREVQRRLVPALGAKVGGEVEARFAEAARQKAQAQLAVLYPEPVARQRPEITERIEAGTARQIGVGRTAAALRARCIFPRWLPGRHGRPNLPSTQFTGALSTSPAFNCISHSRTASRRRARFARALD
jgi:hypothetical protein